MKAPRLATTFRQLSHVASSQWQKYGVSGFQSLTVRAVAGDASFTFNGGYWSAKRAAKWLAKQTNSPIGLARSGDATWDLFRANATLHARDGHAGLHSSWSWHDGPDHFSGISGRALKEAVTGSRADRYHVSSLPPRPSTGFMGVAIPLEGRRIGWAEFVRNRPLHSAEAQLLDHRANLRLPQILD